MSPGPPDRTAPLLAVTGLHVTFPGGARAVRGMSFEVAPGETLALVGESGAGKTATALALVGLLPATAEVKGSVRLRGRELLGLGDRQLATIRGSDLAMIFQDPVLTPVYRVGDQIAETIRAHHRIPRHAATVRAVELLGLAGVPDAARVARAFPHELSGGLRRRVMIAIAVAADPAVILADEPTAALDANVQADVLDALQAVRRRTGAALVLITHDLAVVAGLADRVLVMYAGRPVELGTADDVFYRPRMPYTAGLLAAVAHLDRPNVPPRPIAGPPPSAMATEPGCVFAPRCALAAGECREGEPELRPVDHPGHLTACVRAVQIDTCPPAGAPALARGARPSASDRTTGRHDAQAAGRPSRANSVVLEVDGLVKHYPLVEGRILRRRTGTVRAVDGIGFDVRTGETLGLVGESGCGKTTALLEILRLDVPQAGRVTVFGRDTATLSSTERRALRRDLQLVFQDPLAALDPRMTVGASLAEPLRAHGGHDSAARIPELLLLVGLEPAHASRHPGELSGGQRQRVGIARALALEPKLLLMDEPFSALDVSVRAGIIALLRELKADLGLSYVIAAHDLAALRGLADRVAVMRGGRIMEIGEADAVYETPAHPYTRALLSAVPIPDPHRERARRRARRPPDSGQSAGVPDEPGRRPDPPARSADGQSTSPAGGSPALPADGPFALPAGRPPTRPLPRPPSGRPHFASPDPRSGCRFRADCPAFEAFAVSDRRRCTEEEPAVQPVDLRQAVACHFPAEMKRSLR